MFFGGGKKYWSLSCMYFFLFLVGSITFFSPYLIHAYHASKQNFEITAYYSPLPDQKSYLTDSYSKDIELNGNGIMTASGKHVYEGVIAAPEQYPFGTKIYLPGIGIYTVEDRGGAIQSGEQTHRLDIWMGKGDIGLQKAKNWGVQKKLGVAYFSPNKYILALQEKNYLESDLFQVSLEPNHVGLHVDGLQSILYEIGFLEKNFISGVYDAHTKKGVFQFQKKYGLVMVPSDVGAGYFGPKTRKKMFEVYQAHILNTHVDITQVQITFKAPLERSTPDHIRVVQMYLAHIKKYTGPIDGTLSPDLNEAIFQFQHVNGIVRNRSDIGAGYFGPVTRKIFSKHFSVFQNTTQEQKKYILARNKTPLSTSYQGLDIHVMRTPVIGDRGDDIKKLQQLLKHLGFFTYPHTTGYFGEVTQKALIDYQVDRGVIPNKGAHGSGVLGPKTRTALAYDIKKIHKSSQINIHFLRKKILPLLPLVP